MTCLRPVTFSLAGWPESQHQRRRSELNLRSIVLLHILIIMQMVNKFSVFTLYRIWCYIYRISSTKKSCLTMTFYVTCDCNIETAIVLHVYGEWNSHYELWSYKHTNYWATGAYGYSRCNTYFSERGGKVTYFSEIIMSAIFAKCGVETLWN